MTKRVLTVRCSNCKRLDTVSATLEEARQMRCGLCHQKMTVAGHMQGGMMQPGEPASVTKAPADESLYWKLTPDKEHTARRLVLSAFGEE